MSKAISLIIPTYNERDNIVPLVKEIHDALSNYEYEILFVDDDSSDGTAELVSTLSAKYPVKVIVRRNKRGLASAVVDGLEQVAGEILGVMDADLQHPPEIIPGLLEKAESGVDIVIASRYVRGGACRGLGLARKIVSKGAIFVAHLLLPFTRQVRDPISGFFAFRRSVVRNIALKPIGYKILLELLVIGKVGQVAEVPFSFNMREQGASKFNTRQQIDYLRHVFSLMQRSGELWRFIKFCLIGFCGVLVNIGLLSLLTEFVGLFYLVSAAISIEAAIIFNFTLNNFFTFSDRRLLTAKSFIIGLSKFNLISLAGLAVNISVLWLLTDTFGIYYLVSELGGIAAATIWNYLANTWWTWR